MKTFDEAQDEVAQENEEKFEEGEGAAYELRSSIGVDVVDTSELADQLDTIVRATPDNLVSSSDEKTQLPSQPRTGFRGVENIFGQLGLDIDNLEEKLQNINEVALGNLNQSEVLRVIAQVLTATLQIQRVQALATVAQTDSLFSIADYTSPFTSITVSGVNVTENADSPEPVVPQSNQTDIATKSLTIRADKNNRKPIAIGDSKVNPKSGFILHPGEAKTIDIDLREEVIYMASEKQNQAVQLLGVF